MSSSHTIFHRHILETPDGSVDSTNTEFILSYTPDSTSSIKVYINGLQQFIGVDFDLVGEIGYSDQSAKVILHEAPLDTKGRVDDIKVEYTTGTRVRTSL